MFYETRAEARKAQTIITSALLLIDDDVVSVSTEKRGDGYCVKIGLKSDARRQEIEAKVQALNLPRPSNAQDASISSAFVVVGEITASSE